MSFHAPESALPGMLRWLRLLATMPGPDVVLAALVHGPMAGISARSGMLWRLEGDDLIQIAAEGHSPEAVARFAVMPMSLRFGINRAVASGDMVILSWEEHTRDTPATRLIEEMLREVTERLSLQAVVNVPIVHLGEPVGGVALTCSRDVAPTDQLLDELWGISAALGLWLTHPALDLPRAPAPSDDDVPIALTERQREILRMVEAGATNAAVAATLGYSASTVKQDLVRAMRAMGAHDRLEAARNARSVGLLDEAVRPAGIPADVMSP